MQVLFIHQDERMPSSRIRILNLLPEIPKEEIHPSVVVYPKRISEKIRLLKKFRQFDIIYLQKKLLSPVEVKFFRRYAKKLVFDFDDAIYYRDDLRDSFESTVRHFKFKYLVNNADLVVAGNRILSEYASQFNKNIVLIPSAVETRNIPIKDYEHENEEIIIGWIGGKGNLHHLGMLSSVFQRLSQVHRIKVNIVSNNKINIPGVKTNYIPWALETQEKEIARFDIGVMPLPDNKWTQGKCGYKALQYMAAAVPPVVSDVGINRDIVEHGKEGFVARTMDEFYEALKILMENKNLRKKLGYNARKKVEEFYSIPVVVKKLVDVLDHL